MHFGRQEQRAPLSVPLQSAIITWLPIALGTVLGTIMRLVVFVFGGGKAAAAMGSILCASLGATGAVLWLGSSRERSSWLESLGVSVTWVLLTILFRAIWVGVALGGGWEGVTLDYQLRDGQPVVIMLAIVAAAPLIMEWRSRRPDPSLD